MSAGEQGMPVISRTKVSMRRRSNWPAWAVFAGLVLFCSGFLWKWYGPAFGRAVNRVADTAITLDPDLAQVRQYLRENLDADDWQEVRWWPAQYDKESGDKVCRLKYRVASPIGMGKILHDTVFVWSDGRWAPHPNNRYMPAVVSDTGQKQTGFVDYLRVLSGK